MKEKVKQEYFMREKLVVRLKLYSGNLIRVIDAWAIGVVRYSAGILDWSEQELRVMDVKSRKGLPIIGAFLKKG